MEDTAYNDLAKRIRNELGCSRELAADYAAAIGDKPELEGEKVVVRNDSGRIIARLPKKVLD